MVGEAAHSIGIGEQRESEGKRFRTGHISSDVPPPRRFLSKRFSTLPRVSTSPLMDSSIDYDRTSQSSYILVTGDSSGKPGLQHVIL